MTNNDKDKSVIIANSIEDDIASMHMKLSYLQIVKLALLIAKKILAEIPMYTGELNPKWAIYNFTVELLNSRLNGIPCDDYEEA